MTFLKELENLINRYSKENGSDTPDFILAEYLNDCLETFNHIHQRRSRWYNEKHPPMDLADLDVTGSEPVEK